MGRIYYINNSWRQDCAFANTKQGKGLGAKNPNPSHCGSVLGLPCQMAMEGGGGW